MNLTQPVFNQISLTFKQFTGWTLIMWTQKQIKFKCTLQHFLLNFQSFMIILWYLSIRFCRKKFSWSNTVFATWPQVRLVLTSEMPLSAYGLTFKVIWAFILSRSEHHLLQIQSNLVQFSKFFDLLEDYENIQIFGMPFVHPAHFWSCMFQSKAKKSDGQVAKILRTDSGPSWLLGVDIL